MPEFELTSQRRQRGGERRERKRAAVFDLCTFFHEEGVLEMVLHTFNYNERINRLATG